MNDLPIIKSKAESKTTQVIGNLTGTEVSSGVNFRTTDTVSDRLKFTRYVRSFSTRRKYPIS
jgi:hypothetical protein